MRREFFVFHLSSFPSPFFLYFKNDVKPLISKTWDTTIDSQEQLCGVGTLKVKDGALLPLTITNRHVL